MPKRIYTVSNGTEEIDFEWDGEDEPTQDVLDGLFTQPAQPTVAAKPAPKDSGSLFGDIGRGLLNHPRETIGGFFSGAKESGTAQVLTPDFVLEGRAPLKADAQRILPGVAGMAAGIGTALTGVGLPVAIPTAMAATGVTSAALGNPASTVARDVLLEGAAGSIPLIGKGLSVGGRAMLRGSLGLKGTAQETAPIVETALREGINASTGGLNKLTGRINQLNAGVQRALKAIADKKVSLDVGVDNMRKLRADMVRNRVPQADIAQLDSLIDDLGSRAGDVGVLDAQATKTAGHRRLASYYASDAPGAARKQGEEAYLQGVREGIERTAQEHGIGDAVGPVNAKVAEMHELESVLRKGTDPRFTGQDAASTLAFGPKYTIARIGMRGAPQSVIGRRLAKEGDAIQRWTGVGRSGAAEKARAERKAAEQAAEEVADLSRTVRNTQPALNRRAELERQGALATRVREREKADALANEAARARSRETQEAADRYYGGAFESSSSVGSLAQPERAAPLSIEDEIRQQTQRTLFVDDAIDATRGRAAGVPGEAPGYSALEQPDMFGNPSTIHSGRPEVSPDDLLMPSEADAAAEEAFVANQRRLYDEWKRSRALVPVGEQGMTRTSPSALSQVRPDETFALSPDGTLPAEVLPPRQLSPGFLSESNRQMPSTGAVDMDPLFLDPRTAELGRPQQSPRQLSSMGESTRQLSPVWEHELGLDGDFGILSAANPGKTLSPEENAIRQSALLSDLRGAGYTDIDVNHRGVFGGSAEPSYYVKGMSADDVKRLAGKYGQVSAISRQGYHRLADNATFPARGLEVGDFADNFSERTLSDGRTVRYKLDFPDEAFADAPTSPHAINYEDAMRGPGPDVQVVDPRGAGANNASGVTDASLEALAAADEWEYFVARPGAKPRPLIGLRPEDVALNPGERLARRKRGTSDRLSLY